MNKRESRKVILKSRDLAEQIGRFDDLLEWSTYIEVARDLKNAGSVNAGVFGVACPSCYLPVAATTRPRRGWCHCGTAFNKREILNAIGAPSTQEAHYHNGKCPL